MSIVKVKDKTFKTFIPEEEIQRRVKAVAEKLNKDMAGKNPLLLAVLNGSFIFAADLMRYITIPCEISFVKLASYEGTTSTGKIKEVVGINQDLAGRTVVIVEDIVDTGHTMKHMLESLSKHNPESPHICTPPSSQVSSRKTSTSSTLPWRFLTTSSSATASTTISKDAI